MIPRLPSECFRVRHSSGIPANMADTCSVRYKKGLNKIFSLATDSVGQARECYTPEKPFSTQILSPSTYRPFQSYQNSPWPKSELNSLICQLTLDGVHDYRLF